MYIEKLPGGSVCKESAYNVGDLGLIPGLGRCPGEGHGNPLQYSGLENPMDGGPGRLQSMELSMARVLDWAAIPFSRGSSQLRDQTQVSHITGRFFTI